MPNTQNHVRYRTTHQHGERVTHRHINVNRGADEAALQGARDGTVLPGDILPGSVSDVGGVSDPNESVATDPSLVLSPDGRGSSEFRPTLFHGSGAPTAPSYGSFRLYSTTGSATGGTYRIIDLPDGGEDISTDLIEWDATGTEIADEINEAYGSDIVMVAPGYELDDVNTGVFIRWVGHLSGVVETPTIEDDTTDDLILVGSVTQGSEGTPLRSGEELGYTTFGVWAENGAVTSGQFKLAGLPAGGLAAITAFIPFSATIDDVVTAINTAYGSAIAVAVEDDVEDEGLYTLNEFGHISWTGAISGPVIAPTVSASTTDDEVVVDDEILGEDTESATVQNGDHYVDDDIDALWIFSSEHDPDTNTDSGIWIRERGPDGPPGPPGQDAESDAGWVVPGPPGPAGPAGATGATGPAGSGGAGAGAPGMDGLDGDDAWAIPGPRGADGAVGATGASGAVGATGVGLPGVPGRDAEEFEPWPTPGPAGPAGAGGGSAFIGCAVYRSSPVSVNNAVVPFDAEEFDTDAFHNNSTNPSRITIPAGMGGKYLVMANIYDITGSFVCYFLKNGATTSGPATQTPSSFKGVSLNAVYDLAAGDYIEVYVSTGGSHSIYGSVGNESTSRFQIVKLDSGKVGAGIGALAYRTGNQTGVTAETAMGMNAEAWDTDGFHDTATNNSRLTIPAGLGGKYVITGSAYCVGIGSTNYIDTRIRKNGTTYLTTERRARSPDDNSLTSVSCIVDLVAGDYVELTIQSDDASIDIGTGTNGQTNFISIARLDSGSSGVGTSARGHIYHNATQTVNNGVEGPLAMNSERSDTGLAHDTSSNNSRVIPLTAGRYLVTGSMQVNSDLATGGGASFLAIKKNGSDYSAVQVLPAVGAYHAITGQVDVNGSTDYFELMFFNASGGTRTVSASSATGFSCDLTWTQI